MDIRYLIVGDDFRFGAERNGDYALLKQAGADHHFVVTDTPTFLVAQQRVSSTRIRQLLQSKCIC